MQWAWSVGMPLKSMYLANILVSQVLSAVDELLPAHMLSESETAQGLAFKRQLDRRECARHAFIQADNDAALRRAMLRRSRPGDQQYSPWWVGNVLATREGPTTRILGGPHENRGTWEPLRPFGPPNAVNSTDVPQNMFDQCQPMSPGKYH